MTWEGGGEEEEGRKGEAAGGYDTFLCSQLCCGHHKDRRCIVAVTKRQRTVLMQSWQVCDGCSSPKHVSQGLTQPLLLQIAATCNRWVVLQ
jgi:hypothetical protein